MSVIAIKNVGVTIRGTTILENIDLSVTQGKITGLLGPSGAGKTTLFRAILGLRPISSGAISIHGKNARDKSTHRRIGYMTQNSSIYTDLTVAENLRYFAGINGAKQSQIDELIETVDLTHRKHAIVKNLSGGEKTRVSLMTALLGNPDILLLDEPTVGLDPVLREKLWQLFHDYANQGKTIVVTSHMMDEANRCDDIIFIRGGKLIAHGTKQAVLKQGNAKTMEDAFLHLASGGQA